jgi:translation initiation factor 4A
MNFVKHFILDEADEMLSRFGFQDDVYHISTCLKEDAQICVFSATFSPETMEIVDKLLKNPLKITVKAEELTLEGIRQYYIDVGKEEWKLETLCDLYNSISINSCVIFCNTRKKVDWLRREMESRNFTVACTHGALTTDERRELMQNFRAGNSRVLITTDLLARGIDVQHVSIVINYDLPFKKEMYLHRIGRSGRFGRKGLAINFVKDQDVEILRDLERFYDTQIEELPANIADII